MSKIPLRIEQLDTVLYNSNLNPMGIPESVNKALNENLNSIIRYPSEYYGELEKAISAYSGADADNIVLGNGLSDMLRLYCSLIIPQKALILAPTATEYAKVLSIYGCEVTYYSLNEEKDYVLDVKDFVSKLDSSYDMVILGNPNNPTSQIISRMDMELIAEVTKELEIFLIIDEMYIEFTEDYGKLTSIPLVKEFDNMAILRSVSKFFAVPGLRLAYSIINNPSHMDMISVTKAPNNISTLTAAACTAMFKDKKYIEESRSQIHTERSLIYSAMSTNKNIMLFKPYANFMLVKILKDDLTAQDIEEHCRTKGIIIRNCSNFHGLDNKYIRFCFMKPKQNDLLVNTILELL
ncbi:MAG: aminotransferase class I/II-fold pyridoxal phosphate-dependent enzyme [Lachnospiraceae bacterium]|nr:aminotransferase class I/II-fold pyridoxal phosphate-dependent enzyme [Lachnospiraceae bacterium]MBQ9233263.1 aminotransferase class I/II-fold pyridoxal phosphate-dependent enzyme [Lachnospiraceae bacterium]